MGAIPEKDGVALRIPSEMNGMQPRTERSRRNKRVTMTMIPRLMVLARPQRDLQRRLRARKRSRDARLEASQVIGAAGNAWFSQMR